MSKEVQCKQAVLNIPVLIIVHTLTLWDCVAKRFATQSIVQCWGQTMRTTGNIYQSWNRIDSL